VPELPEVETIRAGLARTVVGARVTDVEVLRDRSIRRHVGGEAAFVAALRGRRLSAAVRRGKFLWFILSDDDGGEGVPRAALMAHLGMSGQLLVRTGEQALSHSAIRASEAGRHSAIRASEADRHSAIRASEGAESRPELSDWIRSLCCAKAQCSPTGPQDDKIDVLAVRHPHLRVRLHLEGGDADAHTGPPVALDFVDQRTFGHLLVDPLVATPDGAPGGAGAELAALPASAAHIARDLLDPAFDLHAAVADIRRRRTGIKRALLDQQVVSGIGNIYADEALWRAGVHFARATDRLRPIDVARVLEAAADVMTESLAQGGTSFDTLYVDVAGESGYFARSLAVYGREGEACPRCGTPITRATFMNRSAHFCPKCQSTPRGANARW